MFTGISRPTFKRPSKLNAYHILAISFLVVAVGFKCFLKLKQIIFLSNVTFPVEFAKRNVVDEERWKGILRSQIVRESADLVYILVDGCLDVFIIYFGILPWLWDLSSKIIFVRQIADKSKPIKSEILQSIIFTMVISVMNLIVKLPFILISLFTFGPVIIPILISVLGPVSNGCATGMLLR